MKQSERRRLPKLNFPPYSFRFKNSENKTLIFDELRKKYVRFSPEEWVRQHAVKFLVNEKEFPKTLLNAEKQIRVYQMDKRYDIVAFRPGGAIELIVECKAPTIKITQEVFDQIARYNLVLKANYLMVTNGMDHFYCQMDYQRERYHFLRELPVYSL